MVAGKSWRATELPVCTWFEREAVLAVPADGVRPKNAGLALLSVVVPVPPVGWSAASHTIVVLFQTGICVFPAVVGRRWFWAS